MDTLRTILLTGFEPFDGATENASWRVAQRVAELWDDEREGARLVTTLLPVTYADAPAASAAAVEREQPSLILHLGLAGRRAAVEVERVAINLADARITDNAGAQPIDEPLDPTGPAARFATIPAKAAVTACTERGLPVKESLSAGAFVCNATLYHSLAGSIPAGFVHLPAVEGAQSDGAPSLPLDTMAEAVSEILRTCLISAS